jgi:endoglucanase
LVETPSPSGFEQEVQRIIKEEMKKYTDSVKTDVHGNVIGVLNPNGTPRVMLSGHCDEIGFMVNYITDDGYIYFSAIGGVDASLLPGQRVLIHSDGGKVLGVVGKKSVHLMEEGEKKKVVELHKQWIDIGVKSKKEAKKLVSVGDPITFCTDFQILRKNMAVSKGFDDKMGSFVVVEVLRLLSKEKFSPSVFAVSTVQEEVGLRGARTSAFGINPDVGIAIDVTSASDYPDVDKKRVGDVAVGEGPVLGKGANINPVIGRKLVEIAKREKIKYQFCGLPKGTGTDANIIQLTRSGVATGLVSVPCRYLHTPIEVISLDDLESASHLIAAFIKNLEKDTDFTP